MAVAFQMFWGAPSVYGPYSTFVKLNALSTPHTKTWARKQGALVQGIWWSAGPQRTLAPHIMRPPLLISCAQGTVLTSACFGSRVQPSKRKEETEGKYAHNDA